MQDSVHKTEDKKKKFCTHSATGQRVITSASCDYSFTWNTRLLLRGLCEFRIPELLFLMFLTFVFRTGVSKPFQIPSTFSKSQKKKPRPMRSHLLSPPPVCIKTAVTTSVTHSLASSVDPSFQEIKKRAFWYWSSMHFVRLTDQNCRGVCFGFLFFSFFFYWGLDWEYYVLSKRRWDDCWDVTGVERKRFSEVI